MKMANINEISTPHLASAFENDAMDAVQYGDKTLEEDWLNREAKACKNCKGHKFDPKDFTPCVACDATGVDMYIEYGVEKGKFVARVIQNGIDPLVELCRELRDMEARLSVSQRANKSVTAAFLLPEAARMELTLLEPDFEQWVKEGNNKRATQLVRKHFPQFLCTNYLF